MIQQTTNAIVGGAIALLVLTGVIVGVAAFQNSQTNKGIAGCNSTVTSGACGPAWNLTRNIGTMSNNFATQLGTTGTMFGVALILGAIGLLGAGIYLGTKHL